MAQRTLPGQGLTGFWVLGYDGWKDENDVNLLTISTLLQCKVLDLVAALPGSPTNGDMYILTATGDINKVAIRDAGAWAYRTPYAGWIAWVADEAVPYVFNGSTWVTLSSLLTGSLNAVVYKGVIDCSANPNYPAADAGDMYIVSVAGKIGGASGVTVEAGDMALCKTDSTASGNEATVGAQWNVIQKNLIGAVLDTRQIISGTGLTGGATLTADVTLNVGAGVGILANANDVAVDKATDAQVRAATADKVLTTDLVESASALVTLTDAANISLDWDAGINRALTIAGNRTLDNPTNGQPGTWRTIVITQSGGSNTLAYGNQYKFPGGTEPVLTLAASSVDILNIFCVTSSNFFVFSALDMKV